MLKEKPVFSKKESLESDFFLNPCKGKMTSLCLKLCSACYVSKTLVLVYEIACVKKIWVCKGD